MSAGKRIWEPPRGGHGKPPHGGIGLCGSHRSGKTTLAEKLSRELDIPFLRTDTSRVFLEAGIDPAKPMDFVRRLSIQKKVLGAGEDVWRTAAGNKTFVTDRTPIDMMAYTLADIQGGTEVDYPELERYLARGFEAVGRHFGAFIVLQPGIPLVYEEGKATLNEAYLEHLNSLIIGLCADERSGRDFLVIKREIIKLEDRVSAALGWLKKKN